MQLMDFQKDAIEELSSCFINLWSTNEYQIPIIFKAPTGSGKTVMMADFLNNFKSRHNFNIDLAYLWISFGGDDSYSQSLAKFKQYSQSGSELILKDYSNFNDRELSNNSVFFINWSKIKNVSGKDSRQLRKPNENTGPNMGKFDEIIINTKNERAIVLIIDESHTESDSDLANEIISLVSPRIIINVTATPKWVPNHSDIKRKKAGYIEVLEEDVIESGLIKSKVLIQSKEEIESLYKVNLDESQILIELAIRKRENLRRYYDSLGKKINPLVLIQLPNDFEDSETVLNNLKMSVYNYLIERKIPESNIAFWLDSDKKNLDKISIVEKNNNIEYLFFKQAPATGWDCPRAAILVMYREIQSPIFHAQILGRIKRMPEAIHYKIEELNYAYVYTNYSRKDIIKQKSFETKPKLFYSVLKENIVQFNLESFFKKRIEYNDLSPVNQWQKHMIQFLNKELIEDDDVDNKEKIRDLVSKKIDLSATKVLSNILVDVEIDSYDGFLDQLKSKGQEIEFSLSSIDVEKLYNLLCYSELKKQVESDAKYNVARSWPALKSSLNVWFENTLDMSKRDYYPIIVNDLISENGILRSLVYKSIVDFRINVMKTKNRTYESEKINIAIPPFLISYSDDYSIELTNKCAYDKFYLRKDYVGRQNELDFIQYLDKASSVVWWYKQEDSGREVFSIVYHDSTGESHLFYPDFFIRTEDSLFIVDTKSGQSANSEKTKFKAEALQEWLSKQSLEIQVFGGIVVKSYPNWKINTKPVYSYDNKSDWEDLVL